MSLLTSYRDKNNNETMIAERSVNNVSESEKVNNIKEMNNVNDMNNINNGEKIIEYNSINDLKYCKSIIDIVNYIVTIGIWEMYTYEWVFNRKTFLYYHTLLEKYYFYDKNNNLTLFNEKSFFLYVCTFENNEFVSDFFFQRNKKKKELKLTSYTKTMQGRRKKQEDRYLVITDLTKYIDSNDYKTLYFYKKNPFYFYSIFDGHRGIKACEYCMNHIIKNIIYYFYNQDMEDDQSSTTINKLSSNDISISPDKRRKFDNVKNEDIALGNTRININNINNINDVCNINNNINKCNENLNDLHTEGDNTNDNNYCMNNKTEEERKENLFINTTSKNDYFLKNISSVNHISSNNILNNIHSNKKDIENNTPIKNKDKRLIDSSYLNTISDDVEYRKKRKVEEMHIIKQNINNEEQIQKDKMNEINYTNLNNKNEYINFNISEECSNNINHAHNNKKNNISDKSNSYEKLKFLDELTDEQIMEYIKLAFLKTDEQFLKASKFPNHGCTIISLIIFRNKMFIANLGDCRAIGVVNINNTLKTEVLSNDHKPNDPKEKERIKKMGGDVICLQNVYRVKANARKNNKDKPSLLERLSMKEEVYLAVSRAIGDKDFKFNNVISATPDVICKEIYSEKCNDKKEEKEITKRTNVIEKSDIDENYFKETDNLYYSAHEMNYHYVVMACDGVWDTMSNKDIVKILQTYNNDPDKACSEIIKTAYAYGSQDNLTAMLLKFY
ncbi:protein phosphatase, putative [Plasmodium reichenowi]|uniref:Protein phosphatase, putative n=1 Tax=Plasmodium reichenowi TaxID=5854 RepID=A0A060RPH5_PLARE|nr:protein phosphatase, putative [Plasmodium reichenowi]